MHTESLRQEIGRTVEFSREITDWGLITPNEQALVPGGGKRWALSKRFRLIKKISGKEALTPDQGPAHA